MVKAAVFAVPGNLATPTGGYAYDRRMIAELGLLGWHIDVLDLGDGYPQPSAASRAGALARLSALTPGRPVVIDGLAFGVLPEGAQALRARHAMIALVHHPLALESGLTTGQADALRASERSALACARHVVATSATTARLLAAEYGVASERVSVVEPGTDRVTVAPRRQAAEVALLAVGAVVPRKGYDVLICALATLADLSWRLVIAGDCTRSPTTSRQLEGDIVRLGLSGRIAMRGAATVEELSSLYASSDLFVLPSRFEGYGMAFAEAISHGLPVVATTAGAIPETVPADAGVLVPPDDAEALAAVLRLLIEQPDARHRLAAGARSARFPTWPEQAALFVRVLDSLA